MCGIAGYVGAFDRELLQRMSGVIAHRGPDDAGAWADPAAGVGLVHRRLAIIDLRPEAHQPPPIGLHQLRTTSETSFVLVRDSLVHD